MQDLRPCVPGPENRQFQLSPAERTVDVDHKSDAHNLWERLKNYETAVLRFAKHPDVAFTNNRAERDLRMSKVKQKVSGCFRTRKYAQAYCRISSYLQSMALSANMPETPAPRGISVGRGGENR